MPPRVVQYQLPEQQLRPLPAPYQSGTGLEGAQVARAGQELEQAGAQVARTQLYQAGLDNETRAKDLDNQFSQEMSGLLWDPTSGYMATKGRAALDAYGGVKAKIDEMRKRYVGMAANPDQSRMVTDVLSRRMQMADDQMSRHAQMQNAQWTDDVGKARVANAASDAALNYADPKNVQLLYNTGWSEILAQAKREGWGPDILQAKKREFDTAFHTQQIQARLNSDPLGAEAYFKANKGNIDPSKAAVIEAHLKEKVQEKRVQMADDAINSVNAGKMPSLTTGGPHPPEYYNNISNLVRGPTAWQGKGTPYTHPNLKGMQFETFADPVQGVAAGYQNVLYHVKNSGVKTFDDLGTVLLGGKVGDGPIKPKRPDGGNDDSRAWATAVADAVGLKPGDAIPVNDPQAMAKVMKGINIIEHGKQTVPDAAYLMGVTGQTVARKGTATMQTYLDAALAVAGPDPETRGKVIDLAMKRYNAITAAGEADERRKRQEEEAQGRQASKDLWHAQAGNQLTPAMIEERRSVLPIDEYKALMKAALGEGPMADNAQMYRDFLARLDKENIEAEVIKAMANNQLTTATGRDLVEKNRSYLKDDQPMSPYKSGRDFVRSALDPGLMESGAARAMMVAGQARAVAEFDDWAVRNPGKTRDEMMRQAQEIAQRYSTVNTMDSALATPVPRFMTTVTSKQQLMNPADPGAVLKELENAGRQVISRLTAGTMSKTEAANELRAIEVWEGLIKKRMTAQPPKK